jgi:peptidoglycan-associated lipoprotein
VLGLSLSLGACSSTGRGTKGDDSNALSEAELTAEREARFGDGSIPVASGSGIFRDVNFDFDSSTLNSSARQNVEFNSQVLRENESLRIVLEGHADERGTAEYNLALGAERARSVRDVLVSLGISTSRIETVSYGEEVPLDPASDEMAWAKNRRVHFSAFSDSAQR